MAAHCKALDSKPCVHKEDKFYNRIKSVNLVLNQFVQSCDADNLWVLVQAEELRENKLGSAFVSVLEMLLDTAKTHCVEATRVEQRRFIKITGKYMQRKVFLKIVYSADDDSICMQDANIRRIRELVEQCDGYFRMDTIRQKGIVKLAISV